MSLVHVVKLAVGADTVADLARWQLWQIGEAKRLRRPHIAPVCGTKNWPKRAAELLAGGSLYWVIKGQLQVRQRVVAVDEVEDEHGLRCGLYLDPKLVRVAPTPKRAFQGWRYLEAADAPPDLSEAEGGLDLPEDLRRQLVALGAW